MNKHLLAFIHDSSTPQGLSSCIESYADDCMESRLDQIFNTQNESYNLVDSIAYCAGLPENVLLSYGACLWDGFQHC